MIYESIVHSNTLTSMKTECNPEGNIDKKSNSMSHFFTSLPLFPPVDTDDIELEQFLKAADGIKSFVSILGPKLFSPVVKDMQGNIDRLYKCTPSHNTLKSVVKAGLDKNDSVYKYEPILALLWLSRAIQFIGLFLTLLLQDYTNGIKEKNLTNYFQSAYDMSLKKFHSWITKKIVTVILSHAPDRKQLMDALLCGKNDCNSLNSSNCTDESSESVDTDNEKELFNSVEIHLNRINLNMNTVNSIFDSVGYDWKN